MSNNKIEAANLPKARYVEFSPKGKSTIRMFEDGARYQLCESGLWAEISQVTAGTVRKRFTTGPVYEPNGTTVGVDIETRDGMDTDVDAETLHIHEPKKEIKMFKTVSSFFRGCVAAAAAFGKTVMREAGEVKDVCVSKAYDAYYATKSWCKGVVTEYGVIRGEMARMSEEHTSEINYKGIMQVASLVALGLFIAAFVVPEVAVTGLFLFWAAWLIPAAIMGFSAVIAAGGAIFRKTFIASKPAAATAAA